MPSKPGTSHVEVQKSLHDYFREQLNQENDNDLEFEYDEERDSMERHCLDIYKEEKIRVKQLLDSFDGHISLSLDIMRGDIFVMCLTAHFVDVDWTLKNWVLFYFEPKYSGEENPSTAIMKILLDFNICNKISTLTLGKVDDNDTVTEFIKDKIERKKHFKEMIFRVHCCADAFRHMVEYAFSQIDDSIYYVRLLVSSAKETPIWAIINRDLQRAVDMESKGEYSNNDEYCYLDIPPESEWKKIKVVAKLVSFIYNAAEPLFEAKNPTASMYLQNIWELKISLAKETTSSDEFMKITAQKMLKTLDKYWEDMSLLLAVVTVLDPRCKMKYVEFFSQKYENIDGNLRAAHVLETIEGLFESYVANDLEADDAGRDLPMSDADADNSDSEDYLRLRKEVEERRSNPSFGFSCLNEFNQFVESNSQPLKSELELYLEAPVVPWDKDFDVLSWWKSASPKHPTLAKIARDLLAIPLTLATQENAYFMKFRSPDVRLISLKPELMNALKCTRSW